jgi:adenine-specific DNA-methyltransferase
MLLYDNKKSVEEIFSKQEKHSSINIDLNNSSLFLSENFTVLSGLLKSDLKGQVDLIYIDPPFNTNQNFTVDLERASSISRSANGYLAYSDQMSLAEYLEFIRERLFLLRELLSPVGSLYLHIDYKIGHYIKIICDEVFGRDNFKNDISRIKSNPKNFKRKAYGNQKDMILFYAKNSNINIFNDISLELDNFDIKNMFKKIDKNGRRYTTVPAHAPGETKDGPTGAKWRDMSPPPGRHWRQNPLLLDELDKIGRIEWSKNGVPRIINYADEHKGKKIQDIWYYIDPQYPSYPTEKNLNMLEFIIKQSSNVNSIVLDCFVGGGTTLLAANNLKRRWIGIDTSIVAINAIMKRIVLYPFDFYEYDYNDKIYKMTFQDNNNLFTSEK